MKACISQVCVLSSTFSEDIKSFVEGGCPNMEVWLTKLEKHLESASIAYKGFNCRSWRKLGCWFVSGRIVSFDRRAEKKPLRSFQKEAGSLPRLRHTFDEYMRRFPRPS